MFTKDGGGCFGCKGNTKYFEAYTVTTQSLLQKWLRENHKIDVCVSSWKQGNKILYLNDVHILGKASHFELNGATDNWEEALEKGLYQALLLIKS